MPYTASPYFNPIQAAPNGGAMSLNPALNNGSGQIGSSIASVVGDLVGGALYNPATDPKRQEARNYGAEADATTAKTNAAQTFSSILNDPGNRTPEALTAAYPKMVASYVAKGGDPKDLPAMLASLIGSFGGNEDQIARANPTYHDQNASLTPGAQAGIRTGNFKQATAINDADIAGRQRVAETDQAGQTARENTKPVIIAPDATATFAPGDKRAPGGQGTYTAPGKPQSVGELVASLYGQNNPEADTRADHIQASSRSRGDTAEIDAKANQAYGDMVTQATGMNPDGTPKIDPDLRASITARVAELAKGGLPPAQAVTQAIGELSQKPDHWYNALGLGDTSTRVAKTPAAPAVAPVAPAVPGAPAATPDGATATNPKTGQKIVRKNGQWVPVP